ncbi:hypothetical protein Mgra_00003187 [Meloidogyne graminicola]|uniref:Uncharacterized protein n=1 Tax=Meloidogyne graminicola TaxID=189291 RepID=A0A8S9ZWK5_9BILA|nr:hypothetical protein Mgra_00003187 [Meloidogyne graminicola]
MYLLSLFISSLHIIHLLTLKLEKDGVQQLDVRCLNEENATTFEPGKLGITYYMFLLNDTAVSESMEEYRLQQEQNLDWGMSSGNFLILLTCFPFAMIWISVWIILYVLVTNTDKYLLLEHKKD